ncbi:MAG: hypothetical protein KAW12_04130 [Candidatus Aminicenantes bacterium]|nr:hypothetical protein [Candidatus Aminicenantes bacterium]
MKKIKSKKQYFQFGVLGLLIFILLPVIGQTEKIAVFPDLMRARNLIVEDQRMYISDCPKIYIYSLKDKKVELIKSFGSAGMGPGEFRPVHISFRINIQPDYIFVSSSGKISYFSKEGKFIREVNPRNKGYSFVAVKDKLLCYKTLLVEKTQYRLVALFDSKLENFKELDRILYAIQPGSRDVLAFDSPHIYVPGKDRLFTAVEVEFVIKIFDLQGKLLHTIDRRGDKVRLKVDKAKQKSYHDFLKVYWRGYEGIKNHIKFPEYLPALWNYGLKYDYNKGEERLYAFTRRKKDGKTECYVFDMNGKLLKKVYLPLKEKTVLRLYPFDIKDGVFYHLTENEETEEFELHTTKIE